MKPRFLLAVSMAILLLSSCRNDKNYYYTPTVGVEVQGGSNDGPVDAISSSGGGSSYKTYQNAAYWGEDGQSVNQHYTPYGERGHNYNYYRGDESESDY